MKDIRIEKLTLNFGAGVDQDRLKKGMKLLNNLTGLDAVKTVSNKRIPSWGVRPGLPIGCKLTLRGQKAEEILLRLLAAKENQLQRSYFDNHGNVSFGIHEYIDVPNLNYDASIGIIGFQVSITLSRAGYRIQKRRILKRKISKSHSITKEESISYFKQKFKVEVNK